MSTDVQALIGAQFTVFGLAWLLAARYIGADRPAMLYWALYSLAQGSYHLARSNFAMGAAALNLALLVALWSNLAAAAGGDLFLHQRLRFASVWLGLAALGAVVVVALPLLGVPMHWRGVAYNSVTCAAVWLPVALMGRRVHREFGRAGLVVLWLLALSGVIPLLRNLQLLASPELASTGGVAQQPSLSILVVVLVVGNAFQLLFLGLVVGRMVKGLQRLAHHDGLTGLLNRTAFEDVVRRTWAAAQRRPVPISLAFLDIDHFKRINDLAGHSAGDRALCQVADLLRRQARQSDTVARLGGEEFVLLMPDTPAEGALGMVQRLQSELAVLGIPMPEAHGQQAAPGTLTLSIGLCTLSEFSSDPADLVARADQAMYQAKREGRNRIVVSSAGPTQRSSRFPSLARAA